MPACSAAGPAGVFHRVIKGWSPRGRQRQLPGLQIRGAQEAAVLKVVQREVGRVPFGPGQGAAGSCPPACFWRAGEEGFGTSRDPAVPALFPLRLREGAWAEPAACPHRYQLPSPFSQPLITQRPNQTHVTNPPPASFGNKEVIAPVTRSPGVLWFQAQMDVGACLCQPVPPRVAPRRGEPRADPPGSPQSRAFTSGCDGPC